MSFNNVSFLPHRLTRHNQWDENTLPIKYFYFMLIVYFVMAWFNEGYAHADEHFQILEFASYKIHQYPYTYPWELSTQIRPTFQAWTVIWLYKAFTFFDPDISPFFIAFLTRTLAGVLSAASCYLFINAFQAELNSPDKRKWFFLLSAFSYIAVYCAVRYSSESLSASFFLIAFSLIFYKNSRANYFTFFAIGILLGAAFITRYQIGLMIFGLVAWLVCYKKIKPSALIAIFAGLALVFILGIYLDSLFYGKIICTAWRYFETNIIQDRASTFGKSHWTYFGVSTYLPYGPLYIFSSLLFIIKRPKHAVTWTIVPFILCHFIIPHKEMRFLVPIFGFMSFILVYSVQIIQEDYQFNILQRLTNVNKIAWSINCIMVLVALIAAHRHFGVYKFIWQQYKNQLVSLNLFTKQSELHPDNSVVIDMPLRFYLSDRIYTKNYNHLDSFYCQKNAFCLAWLPCYQPLLPDSQSRKLVYDSCPSDKIRSTLNFANWMDRSAPLRQNGRVYELQGLV